MTTNAEIQKRHGSKKGDIDYNGIREMLNEARADTAEQIFAELDKMIEELDDSLRTIGEITLDEEKYEALKKKWR
jgi:hypothetical protein